jgi:hypothetical protein
MCQEEPSVYFCRSGSLKQQKGSSLIANEILTERNVTFHSYTLMKIGSILPFSFIMETKKGVRFGVLSNARASQNSN